MTRRKQVALVVVVDFILGIVLMQQAILQLSTIKTATTPPRVETLGQVAVMSFWKRGSNNDIDLYVRDPRGRICYFAANTIGLMHLEYDDLGTVQSNQSEGVRVAENGERIVIRGAIPGEYTVNIHFYSRTPPAPRTEKVRVELWRLRGNDRLAKTVEVELRGMGDERTAFRFTLDAAGNISKVNQLSAEFVGTYE